VQRRELGRPVVGAGLQIIEAKRIIAEAKELAAHNWARSASTRGCQAPCLDIPG
jgi:hypothetical protein